MFALFLDQGVGGGMGAENKSPDYLTCTVDRDPAWLRQLGPSEV